MFYHDALALMTAGDTERWMKNTTVDGKPYWDYWLLPKNGLNAGTKYANTIPGNSPYFMSLVVSILAITSSRV